LALCLVSEAVLVVGEEATWFDDPDLGMGAAPPADTGGGSAL